MVYCGKCGCDAGDKNFCPECGARMKAPAPTAQNTMEDNGSAIWAVLGFILTWFCLIGGVVLCIVFYVTNKPNNAKSTAIGIIIGFVTAILLYVAIFGAIFAGMS